MSVFESDFPTQYRTNLVVIVETGVHRSIVAMMLLLCSVRHELGVRMHIAVGIVALMLAEVRRHALPAPALVTQTLPPIIISLAASDIHLYMYLSASLPRRSRPSIRKWHTHKIIDPRTTTEQLSSRHRVLLPAGARLRRRLETPVVLLASDQARV